MARIWEPKRRRNWSRRILATLLTLLVSAVAAEIVARTVFGLDTLQLRWNYQPLFVSGDYNYLVPNEELPFTKGGPARLGYKPHGSTLQYDASLPPPHTLTSFGDFLFVHTRARYDAAEADRIACSEKDARIVYVLGGSVAQGFSAERPEDTWHARLEKDLRTRLRRPDVYVFNAAMGGFVSLQERMAYHLVVAPRRADLVLIVTGYNDITIPANSAVRPGDPFQTGLRFSQYYGDPFWWWAARVSAIANAVLQDQFTSQIVAFRQRLETDDRLFDSYAGAIADTFIENMTDVLATCAGRGQACLVGLQPVRAVTAEHLGVRIDDILSQRRMVRLYAKLSERVNASPFRERFIDLTRVFDKGEKLQYYADGVHPNFAGQQTLGRALLEPSLAALKDAKPVELPLGRCEKIK